MKLKEQIEFHLNNRSFVTIVRQVSESKIETNSGYIVKHSEEFLILQESHDFRALGFLIVPINQIKKIRCNSSDKFYDKLMTLEKEKENIKLFHEIDLSNWRSLFKSIKKIKLTIIVECENPEIDLFAIGPIKKIAEKSIDIDFISPTGFVGGFSTSIDYTNITLVKFEDRYSNIFGKYMRRRKKSNNK